MADDPRTPAPLYRSFRELFEHGFTIDWVSGLFICITQVIAITCAPLAWYFAPDGFWKPMLAWFVFHVSLGCLSITTYAHRLISHGAARKVRWPVHVVFGVFGQTMAAQGSIRRWASMHVMHHGVDRTQRHEMDPYSATWFTTGWRNFLWSHMLTYCFFHPDFARQDSAFQTRNLPILAWQDRYYVPLLTTLNFLVPLTLGFWLAGPVGGLCMMVVAISAFVLVQHNTWTVNSVTHMWGFVRGANSSAKNNYIWLGPLGEGNHHADHHDFSRDYRNGFGRSGWLLDPTRYVLLLLNALGLVDGLQRASKKQEAEIIARRELLRAREGSHRKRWEAWEEKLEHLKAEWLEAVQHWEAFRDQRLKLRKMSLPRFELERRLEKIKHDMDEARHAMYARKQAFLDALQELRMSQSLAAS